VTLVPVSLVGGVPIRKTNQVLTAANGSDIPLLGELNIMLKVGVRETSSLALVSEHVQEVMLGIDWLEKNGVVWDFAKGKVTIDGSTETEQTQAVNAVRQEHGVGPSIGEAADRPSSNVSEPGAPDPEVPWSLEGLQAAQKTHKDIAIIIQLLERSAEKPA